MNDGITLGCCCAPDYSTGISREREIKEFQKMMDKLKAVDKAEAEANAEKTSTEFETSGMGVLLWALIVIGMFSSAPASKLPIDVEKEILALKKENTDLKIDIAELKGEMSIIKKLI